MGKVSRFGAACGILGPAAFTAAWLIAQRRQDDYRVHHEHISGLAARDANDPHVMTGGFVTLGACGVAFAAALQRRFEPDAGWGPALLGASGIASIATGLFPRDRRSNYPLPGEPPGQTWVNDVHDAAAVAGGLAGTVGIAALVPRLAKDPEYRDLARPAVGAVIASAGLATWFLRDVLRPGNGILQRANVTIPLFLMARIGLRMLRERSPRDERPAR
jgi:uncharacterized protein DUF998